MNERLPALSDQAKKIKPGIYEHYKGNKYKVLSIARHSETLEEVVVYQAQYGDFSWWVRPVAMFYDQVDYQGEQKQRFTFLSA